MLDQFISCSRSCSNLNEFALEVVFHALFMQLKLHFFLEEMDDEEEEFVTHWFLMRQRLVAAVICLVVQYYMVKKRNIKKRITYVSRHFHNVLRAIIELEDKFLLQPNGSSVPAEIHGNDKFMVDAPRYRGRKDFPTQNVLAACTFDLKFTYVLVGWEGTTSDSRIIKDALSREDCLKIPQGKYYLVDAGFMLTSGIITPYRGVRMAPSMTPDANVPISEKSLIWTSKMDDALIDSFTHELDMGNKVNGTFTPTAYGNIVAHLTKQFGFKVDKEKVKNRWKTLKKKYSEVYDIFKGGMSGFSWNPSTHTWEAEDQVWEQLIEVKPKAANWRNTPLPNFERMLALYGNDRATGDEGDTSSNFPVNLDDVGVDDPSHGAEGESSKKTRRVGAKKAKDSSSEGVVIAEQIQGVVSAMREGNQVFRDRYASQISTSQISGEDTVKLIQESGCDEDKIPIIYCFLMNDLSKLRTVIQCPPSICKQVIMQMVFSD
ncbi:hypothetical protein K1719_030172 [Acacia pycnantha]|nr:hypothetical protein K1719_030172 [Acacia pycnantha]